MDPNFFLRYDRKLNRRYFESQLRRDPNFNPQLYFYYFEPMDDNKFGLYFSQAIAASPDPNDQSVRVVDFLKRKRTRSKKDPGVRLAIDERTSKLYLGFGHFPSDRSESITLRIFDLDFDPADHLGYRRIRVRSESSYVVKPDPFVPCLLDALVICPQTGKLIGQFVVIGLHNVKAQLAEIEQPKENDSVLTAKLSDHKFEAKNASRCLKWGGAMFSKDAHLVLFDVFAEPQSNKLFFICSYDTDLNLVRCLSFNPADLAIQLFPMGMLSDFSSREEIGQQLTMFVGRMHKYVLFKFAYFVLAVKWPQNWYAGKHLPPVQISRVIDLKCFMEQGACVCERLVLPIILTDAHLYFVFRFRDKPDEIKRLALSPRFKDYRRCANCGEVEKGKRKNKDGKRIAQFKVCRLCKKKNFHLFYLDPENACHYCSDECQKKHWKIHKEVHKRSKLNRKKHASKIFERFD